MHIQANFLYNKKCKILMDSYKSLRNENDFFEKLNKNNSFIEEFDKGKIESSISFLFENDKNRKNEGLNDIIGWMRQYKEKILDFINSDVLNMIIILTNDQETCTNALEALSIITYLTNYDEDNEPHTNIFQNIIFTNSLFQMFYNNMKYYDDQQLEFCLIFLINVFSSISQNLFCSFIKVQQNYEFLKLLLTIPNNTNDTNAVTLYSIIIRFNDLPEDLFHQLLRFFIKKINILHAKNKIVNIRFETINSLLNNSLYNEQHCKDPQRIKYFRDRRLTVQNTIRNNTSFIKSIVIGMSKDNTINCLSIISFMVQNDDAFCPQVIAYSFDKNLINLITNNQNEDESIVYMAIKTLSICILSFPNICKQFLNFDFIQTFLQSSFKIKCALLDMYNYLILELFLDSHRILDQPFVFKISKQFILDVLDICESSNISDRGNVYRFIGNIINFSSFVESDFNVIGMCLNHNIMNIVKEDSLSNGSEIEESAIYFIRSIQDQYSLNMNEHNQQVEFT